MSIDFPDNFLHVERTPIQKLDYQIYGIHSGEGLAANANSSATSVWNIPDDGYYYTIDTIFFIVNHLFPFISYLDLADNQAAPSWYTIAAKTENGCSEINPSRMGALALLYPRAIRFRIFNYRSVAIVWYYYCNFFKYFRES